MNKIIDTAVGVDGRVSGFSHHDSTLINLSVGDGCCELILKAISGNRFMVSMSDVIDYSISSLWRFNIIDSIVVSPLSDIERRNLPWEGSSVEALSDGRFGAGDAKVFLGRLSNKNERAFLFQVSCTYGGYLSFVCGSYQVLELGEG